jgi:hypothetical protein
MGELAVYKEERLSLGEVAFVRSIVEHRKIRDISDSYTISKEVSHWITHTTNQLGIKDAVPTHNKTEIVELILSVFKNLSFDELYFAFKMERFGVLGDKTEHFQLFNASYVSDVLKKYIEWKREIRRKHNLDLVKKDQEAPQLSQKEKDSIVAKGVLRIYGEYRALGNISTGDAYIYEVLYDDGFLPTDAETKKKVYEEAKEVLRFDIESKKPLSIEEKEHFKLIMNAIERKRDPIVIAEAKRLMVKKFFRKLANDNDLKKTFTEKYQKRIID